jgi:hypothetical protein
MAEHDQSGEPTAPEQQSLVSDDEVEAVLALTNGDAREAVRMLLEERASLIALVSSGYVRRRIEPHS